MEPAKYGMLTVLGEAGWHVQPCGVRARKWLCRCDCGEVKTYIAGNLRSGSTTSCGCNRKAAIRQKAVKHGKKYTRAYSVWNSMKDRCCNANSPSWPDYGGCGITVCDRWMEFTPFYEDMGDPPDGMSLDRIDGRKGYSPDNCRWATLFTQNQNRRLSRRNKVGVSGVWRSTKYNRWVVTIGHEGRQVNLGSYDNLLDAVSARKSAELRLWGA